MPLERTFSIIKPDGVRKRLVGEIYSRFINAGLNIVASRMTQLSKEQAQEFYAIHKGKPFYDDLMIYMTSGPIFVQVLEGENAIEQNRKIMGATDPNEADKGTIRGDYGEHKGSNVVHGADGPDTAKTEIEFFFKDSEIFSSPSNQSEENLLEKKAVA